ncbi:TPA: hypothetical protein ACPZLH_000503 [Yersinia enterocolitica]
MKSTQMAAIHHGHFVDKINSFSVDSDNPRLIQVLASPERMGSSCHKKPPTVDRWTLPLRDLETALGRVA